MSGNNKSRRIYEYYLHIAGIAIKAVYAVFFSFCIAYGHLSHLIATNQYYEIYEKFIIIPILLLSIIIYAIFFSESKASRAYRAKIPIIEELFNAKQYQEVLNIIENIEESGDHGDLNETQRLLLFVTYKVESLVQLGRIKEATIEMGMEISAIYYGRIFPKKLLEKWYELYGSCESISDYELDLCYNEGCSPPTRALINKTINKGYPPPKGYSDYRPDSSLITGLKNIYKKFVKAKA